MSEENISFVALVTREGLYRKGDKFVPVKEADYPNLYSEKCYYTLEDHFAPLFYIRQLQESPDFEMVEELWMPVDGEDFYRIIEGKCKRFELCRGGAPKPRHKDITYVNYVLDKVGVIFRTQAECQSAIDESNALIQKLSDKSRGKRD